MSFIQTLSGQHIDYRNIKPEQIVIDDIATALSHTCRFAGHLPDFYSVAQHSVLVSQLVPAEFALEALLHDATEAYCCDIPSPLKALLPDYQCIEIYVDGIIRQKFGLPVVQSGPVEYADLVMLATERRDLEIDDGTEWPMLRGIPATDLFCVYPLRSGQAAALFLNRYEELTGNRKCA